MGGRWLGSAVHLISRGLVVFFAAEEEEGDAGARADELGSYFVALHRFKQQASDSLLYWPPCLEVEEEGCWCVVYAGVAVQK